MGGYGGHTGKNIPCNRRKPAWLKEWEVSPTRSLGLRSGESWRQDETQKKTWAWDENTKEGLGLGALQVSGRSK